LRLIWRTFIQVSPFPDLSYPDPSLLRIKKFQKRLYIEAVVESLVRYRMMDPSVSRLASVRKVYCVADRSEFSRLNHFGGSMTLNKDT